uniref:Ground-like domain-containing protein n=1 Tax=Ditylenchus dipsaci TaxID=166011 RepID=A0A915CLD8_9BILA
MISKKVVYSQTFVFRFIFIVVSIKICYINAQLFDSHGSIFGPPARDQNLREAPAERFISDAADQLKSKLLANLNKYSVSAKSAGRTKSSTNEQVFVDDDRLEPLLPSANEREDTPLQQSVTAPVPNLFGNIFSGSPTPPAPPSSFVPPPLVFPTLPPPPSFTSLAPITLLSLFNPTTPSPSPQPPAAQIVPQQSIVRNYFAQSPPKTTHPPIGSQTHSKPHHKWQKVPSANHQPDHSRNYYSTGQIPVFLNRTTTNAPEDLAMVEEEERVNSAQAVGNYRRRMYKQMQKQKKQVKSGNDASSSQALPDKVELLKRLTANANGSLLLLMLNDENSKTSGSRENEDEDSKERRAGELARLLGLDNNSSPVPTQTSPPSTTSRSENKDKSLHLADGWLRSLTASSPGIHLFFPQPQGLARDESNSVNQPASVTLAPPVVTPDLLPTSAPYTLPPLLSEYARPVTSTSASPSGRRSTHQPETYVRDLNDLGEDYDLANTIGGKDAGKGEEEDYEEQSEPCPSAPTTCASNSALGAATWLGGNAKDPNADENTEMCNSRRLSALIQDTIVPGDPEASKRAIQGRAEAEFGGFYNVVCGTGFYSYIAHTDEFCLASTNDINCYVFSPVCSLRLGFAAGIGRRRTSATEQPAVQDKEGNKMSMSSESSDGEENAPAMFPFEVFSEEPRIEKTISSHNKKMLATGGFTFYFGYSTTLHVKQANGI